MAKAKPIFTLPGGTNDSWGTRTCEALGAKFPQFQFAVVDGKVTADGPWDRPANERPAMGTMTPWAEGYLQALADSDPK